MEVYKHYYSGSCAPDSPFYMGNNQFSVGIFQLIPTSNGKGLKKSAVKIRVNGYVSNPEVVYKNAKEICNQLDAGTYSGPKSVRVKQ